ncbi:hypothetical protein [Erythrobacter sp. EC-HK427]|uniref:hypothetical protein n=1 Tax=Erythrobacter sp. EC-HK427 TaxID=2038396 RepID=UPI001256E7B7|nr:hypothetical protein [Erythrobacter sp. EC-HK427]VVT18101.1 conserved hypothetical protein [Erythrobacter sp. EC-HK427]
MPSRRKRGRNKVNPTGRNENTTKRFAGIPHEILKSAAYRALDPVARALLIELIMMENGRNNGSLWLGVKDAIDRLGMADARPLIKAFDLLQATGLIVMTKDAHFSVKAAETSRARCWGLTWLSIDGKPPKNSWQDYLPAPKSRESKRAEKGLRAMSRYCKQLAANKIPIVDFTATPPLPIEK